MGVGVYGTNIPSTVDSSMVDIYYSYHETRNSDSTERSVFTKLPSNILSKALYNNTESTDNVIEGLYNLKLPLNYFNNKGFYTVYIKPREVSAVIGDVSTLAAHPNVRGIVIDSSTITDEGFRNKLLSNNSLVGYRIIYIDNFGSRMNYFRLVTSNNKCEPVIQASDNSSNKSYTYRYNESSSLVFITLTPSSAPSFKASASPYIGNVAQRILFVNTDFEPVMLDIEMVDHDADTISNMLEGSQLRNLDNGIVTTYNDDNEIYHQTEHFTLKNSETGRPVYEVKNKRVNNIDYTQTLEDKI